MKPGRRALGVGLLLLGAAVLGGVKAALDYALEAGLREGAVRLAPDIVLAYRSARLTPLVQAEAGGVRMQRAGWPPLGAERVRLHELYRFYTLPRHLPGQISVDARQLGIELSADAPQAPPVLLKALGYADYYVSVHDLVRLGYSRLAADLSARARFEPEDQELVLELDADAQSLGTVAAALHFTQVAEFTPATLERLPHLPLRSARLRYTPSTLWQRLSAYLAQRNKTAPEELRARLAQKVRADLQRARAGLDEDSLAALEHSIAQGVAMEVHISPPAPISLDALQRQSPERWPGLLKIRIRTSGSTGR